MLLILAKKFREGDQSIVLLCLKGTSMGRVFDGVHEEWSKVQACMHQGRILGDVDEHNIIVYICMSKTTGAALIWNTLFLHTEWSVGQD